MRSTGILIAALSCLGAIVVTGQTPAPPSQTGPDTSSSDSKFQAYVTANCKNPPAGRGGGGRAAAPRPT